MTRSISTSREERSKEVEMGEKGGARDSAGVWGVSTREEAADLREMASVCFRQRRRDREERRREAWRGLLERLG